MSKSRALLFFSFFCFVLGYFLARTVRRLGNQRFLSLWPCLLSSQVCVLIWSSKMCSQLAVLGQQACGTGLMPSISS